MTPLKILVFKESEIKYDGTQLSPHWIYKTTGLMGDALVAFVGDADVTLDHMVDLEDVKKKKPIYSPRMLHFLGEWFQDSLDKAILLQNLLVGMVYESLWEHGVQNLSRRGNDLYYKGRKLSVSIATKSLTSTLIHTGINIETDNTPVPTAGLKELSINPQEFAAAILERFKRDSEGWALAATKVLPR